MLSQSERLFKSAIERLPGPLAAALKAAELVDPCTLRFYPRWTYEQLLEKGIGRAISACTDHGNTGTGTGLDTGMLFFFFNPVSFVSFVTSCPSLSPFSLDLSFFLLNLSLNVDTQR